jgi:enolase-phosphatase E1
VTTRDAPVEVVAPVVVVDIEGTTSPTAAVVGTLYPYAAARMRSWITDHAGDPEVRAAVAEVRALLGDPTAGIDRIVAVLDDWRARDVKAAPLKALQGQIWAAGFAAGELTGQLFPDVTPALRRWHAAGARLAVYSSGSVRAQQGWFAHPANPADRGIAALFTAWFDLDTAGPKSDPASYTRIAAALGGTAVTGDGGRIDGGTGGGTNGDREGDGDATPLFVTDRPGEVDAAITAGWRTVAVARPGEPYAAALADYSPVVSSLSAISVRP